MKREVELRPLILSNTFKEKLKNILNKGKSRIANDILNLEKSDEKFTITYVSNVEGSDNDVTFVQTNRLKRLEDMGESFDPWTMRGRVPTTIGRFIRKIFGTKYNQSSIETFVNKYKAIIRLEKQFKNFDIVSGEDIRYWYLSNRYYSHRGVLGGSCMQYQETQRYLDIYTKNPDRVKLCILKNEKGDKIKGRAIVWKLDKPKIIFMDRIYTNDDADVNLFKEFAKQNGWAIKKRQTYREDVLLLSDDKEIKTPGLTITLDDVNFNRYPYMDTMRFFYKDDKLLSNRALKNHGDVKTLNDTGGYYNEHDEDDYEPEYVMDWRGNEIDENDAVWCEYDQAYCLRNEATRISKGEHGRGKFFIPNSPFLKFSEYSLSYYHKDDVIYSKHLKDWIYKKYAVKVYYDENKTKWEWTHKLTNNNQIGKVDEDYYLINLLYRDQTIDKNGKIVLGDYHLIDDEFKKLPTEPEPDEYFEDVPDGVDLDK